MALKRYRQRLFTFVLMRLRKYLIEACDEGIYIYTNLGFESAQYTQILGRALARIERSIRSQERTVVDSELRRSPPFSRHAEHTLEWVEPESFGNVRDDMIRSSFVAPVNLVCIHCCRSRLLHVRHSTCYGFLNTADRFFAWNATNMVLPNSL